MSDNNSAKEKTESKLSQNEDENETNEITNGRDFNKINAILSALKDNPQDKDALLDVNNVNENLNETLAVSSVTKNTERSNNDFALDIYNINENLDKTEVLLSVDQNTAQNKSVILNINDETDVKLKTGDVKQFLTYGEYGSQIRPPRSTWVFYQRGENFPDVENALDYDPPSGNSFVAQVFAIVLVMILFTAGFVGYVLVNANMNEFFIERGLLLSLPATVLIVVLNYAMACSGCTRVFPCNIVCLVLAVIGMSIICAFITVRYDTRLVFYAVVATSVVIFICMCLAFTNFDFTARMLYIVVIAATFGAIAMVAGLTMMITGTYMKMLHLGILVVGTLINIFVITMELQMILGGKAVEIDRNDYALAAFMLYTSIVDVFIKMVQMLDIIDSL